VLLTKDIVYKIKKPLRFSFLDFSSLEARKALCFKEAALNRRLAHHVYIDVVPVHVENGYFGLGESRGKIIDYAIKMKRLDNNKQMDILLNESQVNQSHIDAIINQLITFHYHADIVYGTSNIPQKVEDFEDVLQIEEFLKNHFGVKAKYFLEQSVRNASDIIRNLSSRFLERDQKGLVRDLHGDLHSKNIILQNPPVIFDCLEFNDDLRHLDILDELAFLAMDLESFGAFELSKYFVDEYQKRLPLIFNEKDQLLFKYYKWYRANIRLKVECFKSRNEHQPDLTEIRRYWKLYQEYANDLRKFTETDFLSFQPFGVRYKKEIA